MSSGCQDETGRSAVASDAPVVALVGQPNAGKTSLFNRLTGSNLQTANYPGVTVEYAETDLRLPDGASVRLVDSPGLASLSGRSPDEAVTVGALFGDSPLGIPRAVVAIVDATQMSRHLYLALQLREAGFRLVVAVTMEDLLARKGLRLRAAPLASALGCPVAVVNGRTGEGKDELLARIAEALREPPCAVRRPASLSFERIRALYEEAGKIERAALGPAGEGTPPPFALRRADPLTERIDRVVLHPATGGLLFLLIMGALFTSIFWAARPLMGLLSGDDISLIQLFDPETKFPGLFPFLVDLVKSSLPESWWTRLLADGLIGGVGAVAVFLPQIAILFLVLVWLEDTGYLARAALVVDRPLAAIGLSGRAFVPLLSGFACAVPAMMATRTIPSRRERLLAIFAIPLMTCSARLPVYGLLLAMLTPRDRPWIGGLAMALLYAGSLLMGLLAAGIAGRVLKPEGTPSLLLELPAYRRPRLHVVGRTAWRKTRSYIRRAGPTIAMIALALWTLTHFPPAAPQIPETEAIERSWGGAVGRWLEPAMRPLGLDWRAGVAMISGFAAREVFPGALAIMLHVSEEEAGEEESQLAALRNARLPDGTPLFTTASSAGMIVFFLFALQCMATVTVAGKESGSRRFALLQLGIFTAFAYIASAATVQGLRAIGVP